MNLFHLVPEISLVVTLAFILLCQISYLGESRRLVDWVTLGGLFTAAIQALVLFGEGPGAGASDGVMATDVFSTVCRLVALFLGGAAIFSDLGVRPGFAPVQRADEKLLVVFIVLSLCVLGASQSFALTLAGLVGLLLGSAVLISKDQRKPESFDAAVSAYRLSLIALALFAGAAVLVFAHSGSSLYVDSRRALLAAGLSRVQWLAMTLPVLLTAAALLGLFPFHAIRLRFLSGMSARLVGFVDVALRLGGVFFLYRIGFLVFSVTPDAGGEVIWAAVEASAWWQWIEVMVLATLVFVPILSFWETQAQRRVAALAAVAVGQSLLAWGMGTRLGFSVSLYSTLVELLALMGAYGVLAELTRASGSERLAELSGSAYRRPFESLALVFFLLTLVGMPPTPGFFAKVTVVSELLAGGKWLLAGALMASLFLACFSALLAALSLLGDSRETVAPKRDWSIPLVVYLLSPLTLLACFPQVIMALGDQAMRLVFR